MRIDNQRLSLQEHQINVDLFLNTISMSFLNQPIPSIHFLIIVIQVHFICLLSFSIYFRFNWM